MIALRRQVPSSPSPLPLPPCSADRSRRRGPARTPSCRAEDRAGARGAVDDAAGGWVAGSTGGAGLDSVDHCGDPAHGFLATVSGIWPHPVGSAAWWRFVAPRGTLVERADLLYTGYARPFDGQSQGIVYLRSADGALPAIDAGSGSLPARWVSVPRPARRVAAGHRAMRRAGRQRRLPCRDRPRDDRGPALGGRPRRQRSARRRPRERQRRLFGDVAGHGDLRLRGRRRGQRRLPGDPRGRRGAVLARTVDDWDGRCVDTTARRPGLHAARSRAWRPSTRSWRWTPAALPRASTTWPCASPTPPATCGRCTRRARRSSARRRDRGRERRWPSAARQRRQRADAGGRAGRGPGARRSPRPTACAASSADGSTDAAGVGIRGARIELLTAIDGRAGRRSTRAARGRGPTGASRSSSRAARRRGRCCCATAATPTTRRRRRARACA